jgi:hypothetical protein
MRPHPYRVFMPKWGRQNYDWPVGPYTFQDVWPDDDLGHPVWWP